MLKRCTPNLLTCLAVYLPHKRFARKETKVYIYLNVRISLDENLFENGCIYIIIIIIREKRQPLTLYTPNNHISRINVLKENPALRGT